LVSTTVVVVVASEVVKKVAPAVELEVGSIVLEEEGALVFLPVGALEFFGLLGLRDADAVGDVSVGASVDSTLGDLDFLHGHQPV
jgi:hypothetical protein